MLDCLILGDSIATGVAQYRQECQQISRIGINSGSFNKKHLHDPRIGETYKTVVISLGTNDWDGVDTVDNLMVLRTQIDASHVIWILPSAKIKPKQLSVVIGVAELHGDSIMRVDKKLLSKDGIHPTSKGYEALARGF